MKRIAILMVPVLFIAGCDRKQEPKEDPVRTVRAMKIGNLDELTHGSLPGRARAAQEVDLAFRVTGPLIAFPVKVGDELEEEDLIAQIDPRDFEVSLRNAEGGLERAKATAERARLDLERVVGLQKKNPRAISETDVDQAREALGVADLRK